MNFTSHHYRNLKTHYGAAGDGVTDDTAAFTAAFAWVTSNGGGRLYLPKGTYYVPISGVVALALPDLLHLFGDGEDLSIIAAETSLTASGTIAQIAENSRAQLEGFTLRGPTTVGAYVGRTLRFYGGTGKVIAQDMTFEKGSFAFSYDIQSGTTSRVYADRCRFRDSVHTTLVAGAVAGCAGRLHVRDGLFSGYGTEGSNLDHGLYAYPEIALIVEGCRFAPNASNGFDIQIDGGEVGATSECSIIRGSTFVGANNQAILTHKNQQTQIIGSYFRRALGTPVYVRAGGAVIDACEFDSAQPCIAPYSYDSGVRATIRGCKLTHASGSIAAGADATDSFTVENCHIEGGKGQLTGTNIESRNCSFGAAGLLRETARSAGTVSGSGVTVEEQGDGIVHKTIFSLAATAVTMVDRGNFGSGGLKIYTFPLGAIKLHGAKVDLALTTTLADDATISAGVGTSTAGADDGALNPTAEANILPATDLVFSGGAIDFEAKSGANEEAPSLDGRSVARELYLNYGDLHDPVGDKTVTATGTITVVWSLI
jgi:hypothetical protein